MKPQPCKTDSRLLGSWKSDDKRTLAEWTWKKNFPLKKKRLVRSIFGKLVVTYGRTKIKFKKQSIEFIQHYSVLCSDETSVAIVVHGGAKLKNLKSSFETQKDIEEIFREPRIAHIHFDKGHYWISWGKNREFFRKIRKG